MSGNGKGENMLIKSNAIERLLRENPELSERRFGLPSVGSRPDLERFNPTVQNIADAIESHKFPYAISKIPNDKVSLLVNHVDSLVKAKYCLQDCPSTELGYNDYLFILEYKQI